MGAEGREVLGGVERSIGDVVDRARVLQIFGQLRDARQQRLLIRLVPREGLQEERGVMVIDRHPEDELLEIPSVIFGMAVGDGHVAEVELGIVLAADAERGGVDVEAPGNDLVEELGRAKGGDRVECPVQDIVVEMRGCHTVAEEPVDGDPKKNSGYR